MSDYAISWSSLEDEKLKRDGYVHVVSSSNGNFCIGVFKKIKSKNIDFSQPIYLRDELNTKCELLSSDINIWPGFPNLVKVSSTINLSAPHRLLYVSDEGEVLHNSSAKIENEFPKEIQMLSEAISNLYAKQRSPSLIDIARCLQQVVKECNISVQRSD